MKPVDYLPKVEPIIAPLFQAIIYSERRADEENRILSSMLEYHVYQFEIWSGIEEYDDERLNYSHAKAAETQEALLLINTASAAASGAVLQIAKQCISMAWPKDTRLSKGRRIGSQPLAAVIWHARNQALHFEKGTPQNPSTLKCLTLLRDELSLDISALDKTPRSLAKDIVSLLGWDSYEIFAKEMIALLGEL